MRRGPDGIRQHVIFMPGACNPNNNDFIKKTLDEVEEWLKHNLEPQDYFYNRYTGSSSIFVHDIGKVFAIKLRWNEIMFME